MKLRVKKIEMFFFRCLIGIIIINNYKNNNDFYQQRPYLNRQDA
jgi:hypothetical protein